MNIFKLCCFYVCLLSYVELLVIKINGRKSSYCFEKTLNFEDHLILTFKVISDNKRDLINAELKEITLNNSPIYKKLNALKGEFSSHAKLSSGKYQLCFQPKSQGKFLLDFEFYTVIEDQNIRNLATDSDIKTLGKEIEQIKGAFKTFESNAKGIAEKNHEKLASLNGILRSIRKLSFFKILIIACLSVFQIYSIRILFGKEKRTSKLKGAFGGNEEAVL